MSYAPEEQPNMNNKNEKNNESDIKEEIFDKD